MRKLTPELLDHLPHDDPGALRSRRDLARINFFMGNESWVLRSLPPTPTHITEIGAGDGFLLSKTSKRHPNTPISAYDLAPRPRKLPPRVVWNRGDLFAQNPPTQRGVLIANLFLHHFTDPQLAELGKWLENFDTLIFNEPLRAKLPLYFGKIATPFIHPITRHDMRVSIEAGFVPGELPAALGLAAAGFEIFENTTWRGSLRVLALRA